MPLPVRAPCKGSREDAGVVPGMSMSESGSRGDEEPWNIARVFAGDGSAGASGKSFQLGHFYAAATLTGGTENFYEIDIESLRVKTRGSEKPSFSVQYGTKQSKKKPLPGLIPRARICKKDKWSKRERLIRMAIKRYCLQNPGIAVIFGGPGKRTVSSGGSTRGSFKSMPIYMRADDGECLVAAVVNAVEILQGSDSAEKAKQYLIDAGRHARSVANCVKDIHKVCPGYDLRKVPRAAIQQFQRDKFEWISSLDHGIWLVRLLKANVLDHCIVVDGVRRVILDSAEQYALPLTVEALHHCGGKGAGKLVIAEVRRMCSADTSTK